MPLLSFSIKNRIEVNSSDKTFNSREKFGFFVDLFQKHGMNFNSFYPSYKLSECSIRNQNVVVIGPEGEIYKCWNDVGKQGRIVGDIWGKTSNENTSPTHGIQ